MKRNLLDDYYYTIANILKDYVPTIPELKITNAKTYMGKINFIDGEFKTISLSKWNLYVSDWLIDQEDIAEIIDTICHEFAHMYYWEHSKDHEEATETMKRVVNSELKLRELQMMLEMA